MLGQLEARIDSLDKKISGHMDREEGKLEEYLRTSKAYWEESVMEVAALKQEIPHGHGKQHLAWDQWIEERAWWADIRKKTITAVIWAIILFLASRIFPGSEQFFK